MYHADYNHFSLAELLELQATLVSDLARYEADHAPLLWAVNDKSFVWSAGARERCREVTANLLKLKRQLSAVQARLKVVTAAMESDPSWRPGTRLKGDD